MQVGDGRHHLSARSEIGKSRKISFVAALAGLCLLMAILVVPQAEAVPKSVLGSFGTPNGALGGQLIFAKGVAVNQSGVGAPAGSVYVAEGNTNHRISQFTEDGDFIRAWGWDVVSSGQHNTGANEQQSVTLAPAATGGTFTLRWPAAANTTTAIPFNASAAQVQAALEAVSTIGSGNIAVSSSNPGGGTEPGGPFTVTFQGALGGNDQAQLTAVSSLTPSGTVTIATTVQGGGFEICQAVSAPTDVCKGGIAGAAAGQLSTPSGIAIDQSNGVLYVTSNTNRRVDVFTATGDFAGAFGWGVDTGAAAPEICTTGTGCQASAAAGAQAGNFSDVQGAIPAVDPTAAPGVLYVPDKGNLRIAQYTTTVTGSTLTAASFAKAFGWGVDTGAAVLETCTLASECQKGLAGNGAGQFSEGGSPTVVAVDSTGSIYATSGPLTGGTCSSTPAATTGICRIQKFNPTATSAVDFGPSTPPGQLTFTSGVASTVAGINLAVDPANDHVYVLRKGEEKEGTHTPSSAKYQVLEYDATGAYLDTHPAGPALNSTAPTISTGLGVGLEGKIYVNYGGAGGGQAFVLGPIPEPEDVTVTAVEDLTATSARLEGTVTVPGPGGPGFEVKYHFEYSSNGISWTSTPELVTGSTAQAYDVEAAVSDLSPNTDYQVRLVATTGKTVTSEPKSFKTPPAAARVALTYVEEVTQTSAQLGAHIDPEGSDTTYHFEWASEEEFEKSGLYDRRVPAFERQVGDGNKVVIVGDEIIGLSPDTVYRFRVVATSAEGTVPGPGQRFETLNACGLTGGRCFELVSPAAKGPVGGAGELVALTPGFKFQAAPGAGSVAYEVGYGFPDSTASDESLYQATRGESEWSSTQLSAGSAVVPPTDFDSVASNALLMSEDLSCGVFVSSQPLTEDTPTKPLDAGFSNLFRRSAEGEWTVITNLEPSALPSVPVLLKGYDVIGASPDCTRVIFRASGFQYPGIAGAGNGRLYEWDNGTLKGIAMVPGPGGEAVEVMPGAVPSGGNLSGSNALNYWNAVSDDGSRLYFTAISKEGGDLGKRAVFLREDGNLPVDVSQSQASALPGGSPNNADSVYQTASTDGSEVFFLGRYGLAPNEAGTAAETSTAPGVTSCAADGTGCDLYRYSVEEGTLTDLSVPGAGTGNAKGASVVGVLGASDDGSHVYFAARGQLIAGAGSTEAANLAAGTYNVYLSEEGELDHVGKLGEALLEPESALTASSGPGNWSSRVTPDGGHLLFETRTNVTGYQSGGNLEAYLYDALTGSTVCISCRRDGQPSVATIGSSPLTDGIDAENKDNPPRTISDDGERVFFLSPNRLASGATEGKEALYLWEDGQISFVSDSLSGSGEELQFVGASASGDDIYFTTLDQLTWQDLDGQLDLYDARVGGGILQPPAPPVPCDPLSEGGCGGPAGAVPPALPPATSTLTGPGNQPASEKPKRKAKKNKKKAKKNKKKTKGKKGKRGTSSTGGVK